MYFFIYICKCTYVNAPTNVSINIISKGTPDQHAICLSLSGNHIFMTYPYNTYHLLKSQPNQPSQPSNQPTPNHQPTTHPPSRWVTTALEQRPVNQTSRLPSVTPVLLRGPGDRRALRCRLPGPPSAFMAQRVAEESQEPEKVPIHRGLDGWDVDV